MSRTGVEFQVCPFLDGERVVVTQRGFRDEAWGRYRSSSSSIAATRPASAQLGRKVQISGWSTPHTAPHDLHRDDVIPGPPGSNPSLQLGLLTVDARTSGGGKSQEVPQNRPSRICGMPRVAWLRGQPKRRTVNPQVPGSSPGRGANLHAARSDAGRFALRAGVTWGLHRGQPSLFSVSWQISRIGSEAEVGIEHDVIS